MLVQRIKQPIRESLPMTVRWERLFTRKEEHTQRKNNVVTRHNGYIDCLSVSSAALVCSSSLVRRECFRKMRPKIPLFMEDIV